MKSNVTKKRLCWNIYLLLALTPVIVSAGLAQYKVDGGSEWNKAESWVDEKVPTINDTAYFGFQMGTDPAKISFTADAEAKNISGDSKGSESITFDMNKHTLSLKNESKLNNNITVINGTWQATNQFVVSSGITFTVGRGALIQATGSLNEVQVDSGGTLKIDGGRLEPKNGKRDISISSGGNLILAGSGSLEVRYVELDNDSTTTVILNNKGYENAPFQVNGNVNKLGKLVLKTGSDYNHKAGNKLVLINYENRNRKDAEIEVAEFVNAKEGAIIKSEGHQFKINYHDESRITLTAI
ncbi:MAG: hypothetical protein A2X48_13015 [Lentisphaerae bacterium GWF2_49_21]|nr:MAG: hypothetical protein A2X48_13015 [Lentisphaerae bacterium GWF2_49_21]